MFVYRLNQIKRYRVVGDSNTMIGNLMILNFDNLRLVSSAVRIRKAKQKSHTSDFTILQAEKSLKVVYTCVSSAQNTPEMRWQPRPCPGPR
jgi:long-subunit acyl-CoA synthetase (AMP-forming)